MQHRSVTTAGWIARTLVAAASAIAGCSEPPAARTHAPHCDLPLGCIDADVMPLSPALPRDAIEDERTRPYHCLVRVFTFPKIAPLDLEPEWVRVLGATSSRRIAPGEYLFENLQNAQTVVSVTRRTTNTDLTAIRDQLESLATRAPLMLSRHSVTVCDLYVAADQDQSGLVDLRGVVLDRQTGSPIEGATLRCRSANARTMTGVDGKFQFPEPLSWTDILAGTTVEKPGYSGVGLRSGALLSLWVERFAKDGIAAFALSTDRRLESRRVTIPPLRR